MDKQLKSKHKILPHRMKSPVRPQKTGRLLSVKGASEYLGVSVWTVRELIWSGKIPCVRLGGRKVWIDRFDLEAFIERRKERFL